MLASMRNAAILGALGALAACASGHRTADQATTAPIAADAASAAADPASAPSVSASAPPAIVDSATVAPSASGADGGAGHETCPMIGSDDVGGIIHFRVQSVDVSGDSNTCTFHFGGYHGDVKIEYKAQGGQRDLKDVRAASGATSRLVGAITAAVSAPPGSSDVLSATPPPDVQKVGDDQTFMNEGPVTQFYAVRGDAEIEVDGGFFPAGVTGWVALPAIASKALASR